MHNSPLDAKLLILALIAAFVLAYVLTPVAKRLALRWGAIDQAGGRKIHKSPMPRLGGLAIYLSFTAVTLALFPHSSQTVALLVGGTTVFLTGVLDDIKGISPRIKLAGQVLAAVLTALLGIRVQFLTNPLDGMISLGSLAVPVTILWLVGITNALNLIDGLDGLAGGVAGITAVTLAIVAYLQGQNQVAVAALVLAAAAAAFLRFNFFPAKLFMGDSGSMFLGFNLAALAILGTAKGATILSLLVPVLALGLPILDTSWAIFRRLHHGQPLFRPDKEHLHHQLLRLGLTQRQAVLLIYGMQTSLGICAVLTAMLTPAQGILMLAAVSLITLVLGNLLGLSQRQARARIKHDRSQAKSWQVGPPF